MHNLNICIIMEPLSITGLCFSILLLLERVWKYTLKHIKIKKSKCCGSEIEFEN